MRTPYILYPVIISSLIVLNLLFYLLPSQNQHLILWLPYTILLPCLADYFFHNTPPKHKLYKHRLEISF
ncbi:DUF2933 domain-containing protein [Aquimarina algiphila]